MNKLKVNIILITHNDLDGVFPAALVGLAYPQSEFNTFIYYCGYDNVNQKTQEVIDMLPTLEGTTIVYIVDISVNAEMAELIDKVNKQKVVGNSIVSFYMFDHHGNDYTLSLNKYCWAKVTVFMGDVVLDKVNGLFHSEGIITNKKTSGTRMFFDVLKNSGDLNRYMNDAQINKVEQYVELVRKYDTWEWAETGDEIPNKLNTLFRLYPRKLFVESFSKVERYMSEAIFEPTEELIISLDEEKKKSYIRSKMNEVYMTSVQSKCAGVVMAEQYINDVAHAIMEKFPQCDLAIVVTSRTLSFRTDSDDVNVAVIAQKFGGNGSPRTSGAQISEDIRMDMLSDLLFMLQKDEEAQ